MLKLIATEPVPDPELVIVPVLLTDTVESVMPLAVALLLLSTRLPVPVTPPETVSNLVPLELVRVVPAALVVSAPLIVRADVVLFSVMAVTFEPTPPLIVVVPVPAPMLVIVPALLTDPVESVMVPVVALLLIVRLLVPVTPPLKVVEMAAPLLPIVSVPVVLEANMIGFAIVNPVVPTNRVALLLPPALSPSVILPVPKAFALIVPRTVPDFMVRPLLNVLTPLNVRPPVPEELLSVMLYGPLMMPPIRPTWAPSPH